MNASYEDEIDLAWIDSEVGAALARGNELIEELFKDVRAWNQDHPVGMRAVLDRRGRSVTFVVAEFDEPPLRKWTQPVGDALHNWRRMLDTLAWDLAERFSQSKLTSQQRASIKFPLFDSATAFDAALKNPKHWLSVLDPEHQKRLRMTQPFIASNPQESVLHWLQDLDNTRKHRGGFSLRTVLDHDEGFLFMKLEDADGDDVAVPDSALHRLSWGRTVIPGLPVIRVLAPGIARAEGTHPVPVVLRIKRDEQHESDLEHMIFALSEQLFATIFVVYTGKFPPPSERSARYGAWGIEQPRP
ncbi:hypothetical protein [Microbacterium hydrocarbonoxydans]|uniref:hypothetical protein n=1 Tax=Microbacterium hydrocarbonoxydans TaxID=273678 RepID=UPI003D994D1B